MRSAYSSKSGLCVTMTIVLCSSALMASSRSMISTVLRVSRSPVGSSSNTRSGSLASARAMVTRCCSPPLSSDGKCCMRSCSPTAVSSAIVRSLRSAADSLPSMDMGSSTFSKADSVASRLNVWNTNPILRSRRSANCPSSDV
mmetsp:Transcript_123292/g.299520  ORF Transcript_123292/g.299520 Transcript_123292/m.299520 type:complete len:143 (-) Transcript_123292:523-951(-)